MRTTDMDREKLKQVVADQQDYKAPKVFFKCTQPLYLQQFLNEKVKAQELEGLVEAMKAYGLKEGLILTEHEQGLIEVEEGIIRIMPVWNWLLT